MPNDNYKQDEKTLFRARGYHVAALAMFDKGFTSEAARKGALDYLNRAYDVLVIEALNYRLWSMRTDTGTGWKWDDEADAEFYAKNNAPALHVWNKDKHPALWEKYATPGTIKIANVLKADRDAIKNAPLIAKPKSKARKIEEERLRLAKTCQICGRPILAERGNIAHHGYQRPGNGWQTNSCFGALHLPFEVSRDRLGEYIVILKNNLASTQRTRAGVEDETYSIRVSYHTGMGQPVYASFMTNRAEYPAQRSEHAKAARWPTSDLPATYCQVKAKELRSLDRDIKNQECYLVGQEVRFESWKPVAVA